MDTNINKIIEEVNRNMFGLDEIIRLILVALFTDGHVLLEGNPGLGKTELVKTLSQVLGLDFKRIQFTPDLMPADITGTFMPDFENGNPGRFVFRKGPIFTSLLLADEINRATPKTQSAMLEAMAEYQVTVLNEKWMLSKPFMVLATQNPIDHEGTYDLPEAQADRFMFKIRMPVPDRETLNKIIKKNADPEKTNNLPQRTPTNYEKFNRKIKAVQPLPALELHIANMFFASNGQFSELRETDDKQLDSNQVDKAKRLVNELFLYGLGPRAAYELMLGAKAWSLMFATDIEYADGPTLARVVIPTLRHRIKLDLDWDERYRNMDKKHKDLDESNLLEKMLADFCVTLAPKRHKYQELVKEELLDEVFKKRGW